MVGWEVRGDNMNHFMSRILQRCFAGNFGFRVKLAPFPDKTIVAVALKSLFSRDSYGLATVA